MLARRFLLILLSLFALVLAGCGDSKDYVYTDSPQPSGQTGSIRLRSVLAQATVPSQVVLFRATGFDANQNVVFGPSTVDKAAEVQWDDVPVTVTELLIEYLDASGELVGASRVRIRLVAGETLVIESPPITLVPSRLERLTVSPSSRTIHEGTTSKFTAIGTFADGSTSDLSSTSSWTSSSPTVASVSQGEATALQAGSTTLTATFGNVSSTGTLNVSEATVVGLTLTPARPSIAKGTSQAFTVEGFFSDGSFQDVTSDVSFSSSNTTVSTVVDGLAEGLQLGQTTITATLGNVTASTVLTVSSAALQTISVQGPSSVAKGTSADFTATGVFSDGSTQDLTSQALWSVDPSGSARINAGRLDSIVEGTVTVTATFGGVSGSADLQISPAVITAIQVEPTADGVPAQVYLNQTLTLKATALLSDRSKQDVTAQAEWRSQSASATVDAGLVTGVSLGSANVTATLAGRTGSLEIEVLTPPLPDLVLQSGTAYTLNTTSGVLLPAVGGSDVPAGWNASEHRFYLRTLTVQSGAILNVTGDSALSVVAEDAVSIAGVVDFTGQTGANGVDGETGSDGEDGKTGGVIELLSTGDLSVSGSLVANGGRGGVGGGFTTIENSNAVLLAGAGGNGGQAGQVTVAPSGGVDEARITTRGGDGGAGGAVSMGGFNRGTVASGRGGDGAQGGAGGDGGAILVGGDNGSSTAALIAGDGGQGGAGAPGGDGGSIDIKGSNTSRRVSESSTATAGAGGQGGSGAPGGQGGSISVAGHNEAAENRASAVLTAGAGGPGGEGAPGGRGGDTTIGLNNQARFDSYGQAVASSGAGGRGGAPGGAGGDGGEVTVKGSNLTESGNRLSHIASLVAGPGGQGDGSGSGGKGGDVTVGEDNIAGGEGAFVTIVAGRGGDGGSGGKGGNVTLGNANSAQGESSVVTIAAGAGGEARLSGSGGAGGSVTMVAQLLADIAAAAVSTGGHGGNGQNGALGGAGGVVTITGTTREGIIADGLDGQP